MRETTHLPLIGVAACVLSERHDFHAAADPYVRAVAACGGIPVIVPSLGAALDADALFARIDGLLLTGSPSNVEPLRYGGPPARAETPLDPRRDATTLPLALRAVETGLPLLAICRGHQELNVALGGTLHQHVHEVPGRFDHRPASGLPTARRYAASHAVDIAPDGVLARLTGGATSAMVNSLHGQAIDRLACGLAIEAHAADGTIEAVRVTGAPGFAIGVQWHPEWLLEDPLSGGVLREFAHAAAAHAALSGGWKKDRAAGTGP
jgi:putative glutamine amidotransferase